MENIIWLILFTYPGAFTEFTYHYFAKDRAFYREPEAYFRTARVFFLSALISLACLTLFGKIYHGPLDLSTAVMFLSKKNHAIYYALVSFVASVGVGAAWYGLNCLIEHIRNKGKIAQRKAPSGKKKQVWMSMMADPRTPQTDYVVEVWQHGKLVRRGLAMHMPDDLREDAGFALTHCDTVEEVLNTEDQDLISEPSVSYVDVKTETEIIIREANKYCEWIMGKFDQSEE